MAQSPSWIPLPRDFYAASAKHVAPQLLGQMLLVRTRSGWAGGYIVETEAYLQNDPASHGFKSLTARNKSMYGPAGHAYMYLIYGYHFCFNAVCQPEGVPEAVLVRAIAPAAGEDAMALNRAGHSGPGLTNGPAKLCQALGLNLAHDGLDLCDAASNLVLAHNPQSENWLQENGPIIQCPRVGISRAADWPLRWYLKNSPYVSRRDKASEAAKS